MKQAFFILLITCGLVAVRADVATSADYEMTIISLDGGGRPGSSENYTNDVVLGTIGGRSITTFASSNLVGYAAQLNNAPIAVDDLRAHPFNQPLDIPGAVLLGNDFDIDGNFIHIASIDGRSEAGGQIVNTRGLYQYVPPDGFNGVDRFNYVILDEYGDFDNATVTMVVAPVGSQPTNSLALFKLSDGSYLLRAQLRAGLNEYYLESTDALEEVDDLGRPIWKIRQIFKAGVDGLIHVIIHPANERKRFYHAWAL